MESENLKIKKDLIKEAQKVDPTKNSILSNTIEFYDDRNVSGGAGISGGDKYDRNTKDRYFRKVGAALEEYDPTLEHFIALISKGILHSSDVFEKDGFYYSREMPLENMEPGKPMELESEIFLLKYLFADADHYNYSEPRMVDEDKKIFEHQNYTTKDTGQFAHFDYGRAGYQSGQFYFREDESHLGDIAKGYLDYYENVQEGLSGDQIIAFHTRIREKLPLFKDALRDDVFFSAVVKKSKLTLIDHRKLQFLEGKDDKEKIESFRKLLQNRVVVLEEVLKEIA